MTEAAASWLVASPAPQGSDWLDRVNAALTVAELATVRKSVERGAPLGEPCSKPPPPASDWNPPSVPPGRSKETAETSERK